MKYFNCLAIGMTCFADMKCKKEKGKKRRKQGENDKAL